MSAMSDPHSAPPEDPLWPRASQWLAEGASRQAATAHVTPDIGVLGVPAHRRSISPTSAHTTPTAVRRALSRYSVWAESTQTDLRTVYPIDLGDVADPDGPGGLERTHAAVHGWPGRLLVALGGDNSVTYAVAGGMRADGLVTLDAHHDLRDGISNGSPVRQLIDDGLVDPRRIVQVGISDFANSPEYAQRARDYGITVIARSEVAEHGIAAAIRQALHVASDGDQQARVYVDIDVDVCDRAAVPACPAAAPGGLSAWELRLAARMAGADGRVVGIDFTEVDAAADSADQRTVRLVALGVLEVAAGLAQRRRSS